ncbi:MAG: hypothetical protein JWP81_3188 [Ferruginibacter sp.]|nr:hypothetical protein [Ferruginibacter sp.]
MRIIVFYTKFSQMNSIALLRNSLGLSQLRLAQYLGVSYSLVAMHEKGLRTLPTAASQKLVVFELFLLHSPAKKRKTYPHLQQQEAKANSKLLQHIKNLEFKKLQAERQLAVIQDKFKQHLLLLNLIEHLENLPAASSPRTTEWIKIAKLEAIESAEKNPLHKQQALEIRISSIGHELAEVKQRMQPKP